MWNNTICTLVWKQVYNTSILVQHIHIIDTPWDEPTENSAEFCMFCTRQSLDYSPWNRFPADVKGKGHNILHSNVMCRFIEGNTVRL